MDEKRKGEIALAIVKNLIRTNYLVLALEAPRFYAADEAEAAGISQEEAIEFGLEVVNEVCAAKIAEIDGGRGLFSYVSIGIKRIPSP